MYQFHYPPVTSLHKTIHNCSTETLTRGPADFPSIPTSRTIYTCYSNLDCSHLKISMWFFSCNSNIVPYSKFSSYCQCCPLLSPEAVPASVSIWAWCLFTVCFLNFFKEWVQIECKLNHRKFSNSDDTFSSFLHTIQLQSYFFKVTFLEKVAASMKFVKFA